MLASLQVQIDWLMIWFDWCDWLIVELAVDRLADVSNHTGLRGQKVET